jgi:Icc-related predicted phosphoesterase
MSDLHLEFGKMEVDPEPADVLILAGDITTNANMHWINEQAKKFEAVIFVPGNHEYYRGSLDATLVKMRDRAAPNVHVLNNEVVEVKGQRFVGSTMWTNVNNYDPNIALRVMNSLNDFQYIRFGGADGYANKFSIFLWQELNRTAISFLRINVRPGDVVITHHAPHKKTDIERYGVNNPINHLYGSDLTELIYLTQPVVWHHGHLHESFDFNVENTKILANPRGYANHNKYEGGNPDFNPQASYII